MLVLHSSPDSASMAPRIVIEDLGLPYSARVVDRAGGELASPEYRALHPLGKIPVLETPDGPMFETAAILLWLADTHAPGRLAPAPGSAGRGAFLTWFFFTSTNLHPNVLDLFYAERVAGPEAVAALLPRAAARARAALDALETAARTAPAVLPADRLSILGVYVGMLLRWLAQMPDGHVGQARAAEWPALAAAAAACETTPAARRVAEAEDLGPTIFTNPDR